MRTTKTLVAAAATTFAVALGLSFTQGSGDESGIRRAVGRYLGEPAVVYPVCISKAHPSYARVGVYPVPVRYTFPFQVVLHRTGASWRVVAFKHYDPLGWLSRRPYPASVTREPWCEAVPSTPDMVRAALRTKRARVSTFGMTFPYVPVVGPPLYKPGSLGYSGDGGAIYDIDKWIAYGARSATARAGWVYNACIPDCATSTHRTPVSFVLTLTDPRPCLDVLAYSVLTVSSSTNTHLLPNTARSLRPFCR